MPGAQDIRAGKAFVEVYTDKTQLQRGLKSVSADLKAFGAGITWLGRKFMVLGAGIVTPLLLASKRFMTLGSELQRMSERTGIGTNALSEFGYAATLSGSSLETVEIGVKRMQKAIAGATSGPLAALRGMRPEDQFMAIADRLNQMQDPTLRAAKALEIFGRSGTALIPMIKNLRALRAEAVEKGFSMDPETVKRAEALDKAWERLTLQFKSIAVTVGSSLAPMLTGIATRMKEGLAAVRQWIEAHKVLIVTLFAAGTAALALGAGLFVLGKAVVFAGTVLGAMHVVVKALAVGLPFLLHAALLLANPWVLLGAAILGVGGYLLYTTGALKNAAAWIGQTVGELVSEVTSSLGIIADSLAAGDFASAAKTSWALVKLEWQKGVAFVTELWEGFKGTYDEIVTGLAIGITNACAEIQGAWANLTAIVQTAWSNAINLLQNGWLGFTDLVRNTWAAVAHWFQKTMLDAVVYLTDHVDNLATMLGPARGILPVDLAAVRAMGKRARTARDVLEQNEPEEHHRITSNAEELARIEVRRRERLAAIARRAPESVEGLGSDLRTRQRERDARIKAAQDAVDAARAEWQAAKQDVAAKAAAKAAEEKKMPGLGDIDLAAAKGTVRGTFAASAVAGLAVGIQQKIAQNTLAMKEQLAAIRRETERLSLEAEP
jgi:hypothetical protein